MGVLFRVAVALLIAIPLFLVLVTVFALAGRRRAALPPESGISRSFERDASVAHPLRASQVLVEVSR